MVVVFQHVGTAAWANDRLKMSVKTWTSCPAHTLRTDLGMLSGLAAFCAFTLLSTVHMSAVESVRGPVQ